jgi:phosphatidylglycerol---prolipoprotein diacylglyceryl transferase
VIRLDLSGGAAASRVTLSDGTRRTKSMHLLEITFPALDPILVQIGPFAIRWYALAYIAGILLGWLYARAMLRDERLWGGPAPFATRVPIERTAAETFDDFVLWVTLGIILGGRIGYVLFYNASHFAAHPSEIFELWKGGMSFHGGFAGCVIAVMLFSLRRRIPMLSLGDVTCAVGPIGLFLGRIANFINGELWGRVTDVPWGVVFCNATIRASHGGQCPAGELPRHASQLYEAALEGLVLFAVLALAIRAGALKRPGFIIGLFAVVYSLARITCEFFREPDVQLGFLWGGLTMGMLLSIPLMAAGFGFIAYAMRRPALRTSSP